MANNEVSQVRLKKNSYKLRVLEAEKATSKKAGSPMLVLTFEIIEAPTFNQVEGDKQVTINPNGIKITSYVLLTDDALNYSTGFNNLLRSSGQKAVSHIEADSISADDWLGVEIWGVCTTELEPEVDDDKEPIINPFTKKPVMRGQHKITRILAPE